MANSIVTNQAANSALRFLQFNGASASSSVAKLSSGSRIVKASDDAASLAVGTKLKADVTALKQAAVNASHATSVLQVADGGMARISDILQRMKSLAVQASSGSVSDNERAFLDQEYQQLLTQIDDIAAQTRFNGQALLNGAAAKQIANVSLNSSFTTAGGTATVTLTGNPDAATGYTVDFTAATGTFTLTDGTNTLATVVKDVSSLVVFDGTVDFSDFGVRLAISNLDVSGDVSGLVTFDVTGSGTMQFQVGVDSTDSISVSLSSLTTAASDLNLAGSGVATQSAAQAANNALDTAIATVNAARAEVGAMMSRFEFVSANLATSIENMDAARSALMDVDVAAEMTQFTSAQVLMQANVAMLAQANQLPQNLLRLLQ
ncbi:A-type flagellin [bacterium HR40]|nr:A-type flagellin [bacterium HR40]